MEEEGKGQVVGVRLGGAAVVVKIEGSAFVWVVVCKFLVVGEWVAVCELAVCVLAVCKWVVVGERVAAWKRGAFVWVVVRK